MAEIYRTKYFYVNSAERPLIDRIEGGHIIISPQKPLLDRTKMTDKQAVEFIKLTILVGKAMEIAMKKRGVDIVRINYQDMGNWAFKRGEVPHFHLHIFGRSKNAKQQPYTEAVKLPDKSTGFYENLLPLNNLDIIEIRKQIEYILDINKSSEEYINSEVA